LTLSSPNEGDNQPDLRRSPNGKLSVGTGRIGTSLNRTTTPSARPVSSSLSSAMRDALSTQSGIQPGRPSRRQVL